ncbi:MAG: 16S rRNA (adenine(1518)-N(6)/adenine(1519)-N(6))-dimethyltransferase RsmA [Candidatus Caldatribacteriaceae bacterium]
MTSRGTKRKKWGQHFLVDTKIRDRIIEEAELSSQDLVVEIGVGEGILTESLLAKAGWVMGFEIDPFLYQRAQWRLGGFSHLSLYPENFLQVDLKAYLASFPFLRKKCVSNIPYSLSTPLFLKLLGEDVEWNLLVLMVQKEFGDRILSFPPAGKGTLLSLAIHLQFLVQKVFLVSPSAFCPNPRVDSMVLKLFPRQDKVDFSVYRQIVTLARFLFSQRRKTLFSLLGKGLLGEREIKEILEEAGIMPQSRVEDLDREHWILLANKWYQKTSFPPFENSQK